MITLDNVTVADTFPSDNAVGAAQMFPAFKSNGGYFTISGNPVYVQLAYGLEAGGYAIGQARWTKQIPFPIGPGILIPGTAGVRFRNYTPGQAAVVSGALSEHSEPSIAVTSSGSLTASATVIPVVNTLPVSPTNQQQVILTDSFIAPTYSWLLQYDTGMTTPGWRFIGGGPALVEVTTAEATASATYVALTTAGPSFTVPRAGSYQIDIGYTLDANTTGNASFMSYDIGGTGAVDADSANANVNTGAVAPITSVARKRLHSGLAASTALVAKYRMNGGASGTFQNRWMAVLPVVVT